MEFDKLIKQRYSVRKFKAQAVEQEKINAILEAGKAAPTATNAQPQRILVLNEKSSLAKIKECTLYHFNAPLFFLVCYDKSVSWKRSEDNKDMGEVDASIVATHMMLKITNLGLGSTWVGSFNPQKIRESFVLPENIIPVLILPVGYPHEKSVPSLSHGKRIDISANTFYNSF
ncbi:nitroreductase family protein [Pectinatus cerevisiiphilus]|uniref:Nitroreductase n=1 Tax=Pectinatus cerevisiiphilus TaxID=86956 RepID=A0A4V2URM1_9FIRM|nr:nitroreductase family protein [Pectinatus cerevisiiphilus]TCS78162.1 nitroreductase [Pectinatus cerevisiiphilus]